MSSETPSDLIRAEIMRQPNLWVHEVNIAVDLLIKQTPEERLVEILGELSNLEIGQCAAKVMGETYERTAHHISDEAFGFAGFIYLVACEEFGTDIRIAVEAQLPKVDEAA